MGLNYLLVAITESSKLLLACSIPDIELDLSMVCEEGHGVHLNTEGGNVLLLKLTGQMTLDESSFTDTSISDEHELELRNLLLVDHLQQIFHVSILR